MRWLLGVLVLSGCATASLESELTAACVARSDARCHWAQRCGLLSSKVSCDSVRNDGCNQAAAISRIHAGVWQFDRKASAACITALEERSCDANTLQEPASCAEVLSPVVPDEARVACGVCSEGFECRFAPPDCARCVRVSPPASVLPGSRESCFSPLVDGPGCADGLSCEGVCRPFAQEGDLCPASTCRPGLRCEASACVAFLELGEPCADDASCRGGLYCADGVCTTLTQSGDACVRNEACSSRFCEGGVCTELLVVGLGGLCGSASCQSSLVCRNSVCSAPATHGEACTSSVDCAAGMPCVAGTCRDPLIECD